jgi:hypothetical protein
LVEKSEEKRPLRRSRHTQEDNIKIDFTEIGVGRYGLAGTGQGPMVGSCEHGNGPSSFIKCWESAWQSNCWLLKDSAPWNYGINQLFSYFCTVGH